MGASNTNDSSLSHALSSHYSILLHIGNEVLLLFFLCHWICTRDLMRFSCMVLSGFPNHSNGAEEIHDFGDICKYTQAKEELGKPGTHPTLETNKHTCMFKKLKFFDNFSRICPCIIISWWTLVIRSCFFLSHNSNLTRFFCFFYLPRFVEIFCFVLLCSAFSW